MVNSSKETSFGLIGAGWRAEFFLRIARDLPERFPLAGVVVRDAEKRARVRDQWSVPVFRSVDELLAKARPGFVVTSVSSLSNLGLIEDLCAQGVPVLSETPIAPELADLHRVFELASSGARIQLAEEYPFQPMHAARLKIVREGLLGPVREADISCALAYHGVSLLRLYLQVGLRLPRISARSFKCKMLAGPGREGPPAERKLIEVERVVAEFDFGDKLGIFDFQTNQHRSWIRSPRGLIRGEEGEIFNSTVRVLRDFETPVQFELTRQDTGLDGNMEGHYHRSIVGGGEIFYENPFPGPRWSDDEIAVATCLAKMQTCVETGESFYSVAEACHDRYLDILVGESLTRGKAVEALAQPWSSA
jgi:hypothetical protein